VKYAKVSRYSILAIGPSSYQSTSLLNHVCIIMFVNQNPHELHFELQFILFSKLGEKFDWPLCATHRAYASQSRDTSDGSAEAALSQRHLTSTGALGTHYFYTRLRSGCGVCLLHSTHRGRRTTAPENPRSSGQASVETIKPDAADAGRQKSMQTGNSSTKNRFEPVCRGRQSAQSGLGEKNGDIHPSTSSRRLVLSRCSNDIYCGALLCDA